MNFSYYFSYYTVYAHVESFAVTVENRKCKNAGKNMNETSLFCVAADGWIKFNYIYSYKYSQVFIQHWMAALNNKDIGGLVEYG